MVAIDRVIPERPIRVGLVGYGLAGAAFHAPLIVSTPGLDLVAIMTSRDVPTGIAKAGSFDELMAMNIDLVVVASPNDTHVPLARAALDAAMHVVVDKPLAVAADEAEALIAQAEGRGLLLSVFQNRRWDGDYLTLRQLVTDGRLGQIHRFESRFERWRPEVSDVWRESDDPARGGGLLLDLGTHLVDQAVHLFGRVVSVYAEVRAIRPRAVVEDDVFVALRHEAGQISHLWMSAVAAEQGPRMRAWGSRGAWSSVGLDVQEDQLRAGRTPIDEGFGLNPPGSLNGVSCPTLSGQYVQYYGAIEAALRGDGPNPVDPKDAVGVLRIIDAARRSSATDEVVAF